MRGAGSGDDPKGLNGPTGFSAASYCTLMVSRAAADEAAFFLCTMKHYEAKRET
jgi:hypothetical protein